MSFSRLFRAGGAVTLALVLAACGGQDPTDQAGSSPPATPPPSAAPDAGTNETVSPGAGLMTVDSPDDFDTTVQRVEQAIAAAPPMPITTIDHAANAKKAGLELPPTTLFVFGAPAAGTPLMQAQRTVGLDLPQKVLVWSDDAGTHVTYNSTAYLAARHDLTGVSDVLDMVSTLLAKIAGGQASPSAAPADSAPVDSLAGVVVVDSPLPFDQTLKSVRTAIENAPPMEIAVVDHAANAMKAGLELPPTTLVIAGAPAVGTPLMQSQRTVGLDLPQKFLVWSDDAGTHVAYNDPAYVAARHGITDQQQTVDMISELLATIAGG